MPRDERVNITLARSTRERLKSFKGDDTYDTALNDLLDQAEREGQILDRLEQIPDETAEAVAMRQNLELGVDVEDIAQRVDAQLSELSERDINRVREALRAELRDAFDRVTHESGPP